MERVSASIIILVLTLSCSTDKSDYSLRKDLSDNGDAKFYKDFDIFSRKGVDEITDDTLTRPFFRVRTNPDSSVMLTVFKNDFEKEINVPSNDSMLYDFDDVSDGPRHNYYRIFEDSIVVFGYRRKIDEVATWDTDTIFLFDLLPETVDVMTMDTLYSFSQDCFRIKIMGEDETEIKVARKDFVKKSIQPFSRSINMNCDHCIVHYFDTNNSLRHYFRYMTENEYLGKKNPGKGQFGYKKEFKYWRDYYIVD